MRVPCCCVRECSEVEYSRRAVSSQSRSLVELLFTPYFLIFTHFIRIFTILPSRHSCSKFSSLLCVVKCQQRFRSGGSKPVFGNFWYTILWRIWDSRNFVLNLINIMKIHQVYFGACIMLICPLLKQVRTAAAAARANQQKAKPVLFVNI